MILNNKGLTGEKSQLIEEKLSSLNLNTVTENRKKFYKQKLSEFKAFLKNEFSLKELGTKSAHINPAY